MGIVPLYFLSGISKNSKTSLQDSADTLKSVRLFDTSVIPRKTLVNSITNAMTSPAESVPYIALRTA
ncbi:MAG: hypothetical protein HDT25_02765 [Ruminococcus sp.]|nr:hypothetical protein [Ruminococcus sp.]